MVINDFDYRDCGHFIRVDFTSGFPRRCVPRFKNQPVRVGEINGILSGTVSVKLMTPVWWMGRHHRQRRSFPEHCEARHNRTRHAVAVSLPESTGRVERLGELFSPEGDFHVCGIF